MTDAELFMRMRASFRDAEKFVEAAADRIEAQAAEVERLRDALAKAEAILEREIMRVNKIQSDFPPPHKVPLSAVQSEYELMLAELKGDQP